MILKPLSFYCTTCVFISLSLLSTYCGYSLRDFASFYLFIFFKLCPNLWFHKWWCELQAVIFTSFFSVSLSHHCTCVWICETGDKFSFVRSLQCERREVRWQKCFGLDFSDKSPPGAFVLFLPDAESVVLWNHVSFSIFRLPILTSKCDPVRTALICFSCFVVDVCFALMKSHPF